MNLLPYLQIMIAPDKYSATVKILAKPTETGIISSDVVDTLRSAGISTGYKLLEISTVLAKLNAGEIGEEFIVAQGKPKEEGVDGFEEFKFRTKLLVGATNDSKVDFKERGLINNVRPGQVLAILKPHIPGKPGMLVTGETDEPLPVKKVAILKAGINVETFEKDGSISYIAMIAGHARKLFKEIQVSPDYVVNGDLDLSKGNIDFVGNVEILGDVKSGFKIKALGDILIGGDVEPEATIIADGNITVNGTIRTGKKEGLFFCKGDITAGTVINSNIECDGNIYLKELLSDSLVFCKGNFLSSWAVILNSTIEAIGGIILNNVGKKDSNAKNTFYSGEPYLTKDRVAKINEKLEDCNNQLSLIVKQVEVEKENAVDTDHDARVKNIAKARAEHAKQLKEEIENLKKELSILLPKLSTNYEAKIEIKGKIFPTCIIKIGDTELNVLDTPIGPQNLVYDALKQPTEEKPTV